MSRSRPARCKATLLGALVLFAYGACDRAHSPQLRAPEATRQSPARGRDFVSPYSYEWFVRGELFALRGEYARAVEAYRMALTSADNDPYVLAHLAEALDRTGDRDAAEQTLQAGLQLDPQSEAIWLASAEIALRRGERVDAIAAFERAEAAAPRSASAPLALSDLLRAQGDTERANAVLERFAARSEHGSRTERRARLELARTRGDAQGFEQAVRAWLKHAASEPELAEALATELLARHKPALAARVISVLPEAERSPRLALRVAVALAESDQVEVLLAVHAPDQLGGPLDVAEAYLRIGRPERALRALQEQTSAVEPDANRRALLHGLALLGVGETATAALQLARVPTNSAYAPRARDGLRQALEAGGLPDLAREVAEDAKLPKF